MADNLDAADARATESWTGNSAGALAPLSRRA
jgi:hypothetical protein